MNVHRRLRNQSFFFITLETAEPENRETATNHSGKGACVYATYRDRSVCAVACSRDCITGSICLRFLFALRCCLNHSLFNPLLTSLAFAPQLVATLVAGPLITTLTTNSCTLKRRRRNHHNHSNLAQINCVSDLHQTQRPY